MDERSGAARTEPCPGCHGAKIVAMEVAPASQGAGSVLRPRHCKGWDPGIALTGPFSACLSCGLVWSAVAPGPLRAFIRSHGDELARQHIDGLDRGPFRDLPDTEPAREIGAAIAEIDSLVVAGSVAAVRRYRELLGVSWDRALGDVKAWPRFTREEKLELFGWVPKKKAEGADLDFDEPFP